MTRSGSLTFDVDRYLRQQSDIEKSVQYEAERSLHKLELAVRWDEADCALRVKLVEPDTLVEPTVVQLDRIADTALVLIDDQLVVQTKLAFWRAGEVGSHEDMAVHVRPEDRSCNEGDVMCRMELGKRRTFSTHAQVDSLHYIHERLILLILDIRTPPAGRPRRLTCDLGRFLLEPPLCLLICDMIMTRTTAVAVDMMLSVVMYVLRVSISLFWG